MPDHIIRIKDEDDMGRVVLWCKYCKRPIFRSFNFTVRKAIELSTKHNKEQNR